jgi:integrase
LTVTPSNYAKRFPDKTLPEAGALNKKRAAPWPALNARTVNDKYLSKLHSILNWCVKNDIIPDNPATGIKVETVKDTAPTRINFSPDDLTRLFAPKFFDRKALGEYEWAMLISLFTGMRATELGQMKLDSIHEERGVLVFAIEEDTKTLGSQRLVPVHSALIKFGLLDRIKHLRAKHQTHLFPKWHRLAEESKHKASAGGRVAMNNTFHPRFIPRRFNVTYKKKVGIVDSRKVWHSFRHTFKTGLSRAGVGKAIRDDLCGHDDESSGAVYVHETSIEAMKEAVEKLQFDGLPIAISGD